MKIEIAQGIGTGPTKLAAFDTALIAAGVANYNLIRLSSIIPPSAKVVAKRTITNPPGNWGNRLYVVMADSRVDTPHVEAWAGIGWVQDPKTGKGLFVEHEGGSENTVRRDIHDSLQTLITNRGMDTKAKINIKVCGATCEGTPVCALVIAVYQAVGWHGKFSRR